MSNKVAFTQDVAANYLFLFLAFCCYLLQQSGSLEGTLAFAIWVASLKR